jgi:putative aminopeptidase FrvX
LSLAKCQLGLFGYTPKKKIVKSQPPTPKLKQLIIAKQKDNRLGCSAAWEIAADLNLSKMAVSGACEALNIRIKPCQLGAF